MNMIYWWSGHTLEQHAHVDGKITSYYLRPEGRGRMQACYLVFTVEGIVIMGDWCPGANGVISCLGYGEAWFEGDLSPDYLASKFLRKSWQPELGYDRLREEILRGRRNDAIEKGNARDAWLSLLMEEREILTSEAAYRIFREAGLEDFDLGYGYDPRDVELLQAIQQRFAACKAAQRATLEVSHG